jgi:hypothetical protein
MARSRIDQRVAYWTTAQKGSRWQSTSRRDFGGETAGAAQGFLFAWWRCGDVWLDGAGDGGLVVRIVVNDVYLDFAPDDREEPPADLLVLSSIVRGG